MLLEQLHLQIVYYAQQDHTQIIYALLNALCVLQEHINLLKGKIFAINVMQEQHQVSMGQL